MKDYKKGKSPQMPAQSYKKEYPPSGAGKLGNYEDSAESIDAFGRASRAKLQKQARQS